jgi:1-acyl-sn-glycerol-3-phosphate acyltransferase
LGRLALGLRGWRIEGTVPDAPKMIMIVAPHTSNWDFIVSVAAMFAIGLRGTFLGKDTLFRWPLGVVMRWLGGFPVIRDSRHNVVRQTTDMMRSRDRVLLALSPEGTRRKRPRWRTGFYYVARGADVPIVPVALDYAARTVRIFPPYHATADVDADLRALGALFHAGMARYPGQY